MAAINHARLDDNDNDDDNGSNNNPRSKWKGPKWKRGAKNNAKHGKNSSNNSNSDDNHLRRTIESDGCKTVIEMAADGNCLFRSLSDQLYHDYGNGHEHVRSEVCDFLEAHRDDFCAFLLLEEDEEDVTDFDAYVNEMRGYGTWGGNVELVVASRLYDRNITIFSCPTAQNNNNSVHDSEKGSAAAAAPPAELSAFTIHNDHDDNEHDAAIKKKNRLPDILLSFHENDHYNSVRDSRHGRPPPPTKTYVKPSSSEDYNDDDDDDEYNDHRYNNNHQQHDDYDTEEKTNTSASSSSSSVDLDDEHEQHEQEETSPATNTAAAAASTTAAAPPKPEANRFKKNDACPCGSGKRYKKCCWAREKHAARVQQMQSTTVVEESSTTSAAAPQEGTKQDDAEVVMSGSFRVLTI